MKNKNHILYALILVLTIFLIYFFTHPDKNDNLETDNKNIYYGSEKINLTNLNDPLFQESEYSYNHKLCRESLKLAVSAYSANVTDLNWGEDSFSGRESNVKNTLVELGFDNLNYFGYDISLNDSSSKVAFAIGEKTYNHDTSIIAIAIRGGNYGLEWADNFNIGKTDNKYHQGFYNAALDVKQKVDELLPQITRKKNIKFWICGYSRGGAVANILASMYDAGKSDFSCQVYAYTFASPKTSVISDTLAHDTIYRNIFNILSPNDPVYNIPPDKWGFGRFGICVVFPDNNDMNFEGAPDLNRRVAKSYYNYTGEILIDSGNNIDSFINILIKSSESRNFFYDNLSVPISDFLKIKMMRYKNSKGLWQNYDIEDILLKLHGKSSIEILNKIKNRDFFTTFKKIGIIIPDDFFVFLTLCHINGYTAYEEYLFSRINMQDITDINYITSSNLIATCHRHEFYMSWLDNVSLANLKFSKE